MMAESEEAPVVNGTEETNGEGDTGEVKTDAMASEEKLKEKDKTPPNPGKALLDYLDKNRSPLSAVYQKKKEVLLEIIEMENYKNYKKSRTKSEKSESSKTDEKGDGDVKEKEETQKPLEEGKEKVENNDTNEQQNEEPMEVTDAATNDNDDKEDKDEAETDKPKEKNEEEPFAAEKMALNQAMMVAVTTCQPEMLEILLEAGADPEFFDKWYPVIHTIVDMRRTNLFNIMKKYIPDIKVCSFYGNLLHACARSGALEIMREVYAMGVTDMTGCDANGSTPLHDAARCLPLIYYEEDTENSTKEKEVKGSDDSGKGAEKGEDKEKSENMEIMKESGNSSEKKDVMDNVCADKGVENGEAKEESENMETMKESGKSPTEKEGKDSDGSGIEAVKVKDKDTSKNTEKNDDSADKKDGKGDTTSTEKGKATFDFRIIEFLLEKGCLVDVKDSKNKTPLHEAAIIGNKELVQMLLKAGANKMELDTTNHTPWMYAALYGHSHLYDMLLDENDLDGKVYESSNAHIHRVAYLGKVDALKFLLQKGASVLVTNGSDETPLYIAVIRRNMDCVKELLNHSETGLSGVNASKPFIAALDRFSFFKEEVMDLFLAKGQDINVLTDDNKTPLLECLSHYVEETTWLLKNGANPDYVTPSGAYALLRTCELSDAGNSCSLLHVLMEHNADITKTDMVNSEGLTPLQVAISERNYELAKLCLLAGFSLCKIHDWFRMEEDQMKSIVDDHDDFGPLFGYIKTLEYSPVSLKGLCRLKVLKCLGFTGVDQSIKQLGLPSLLEDFLNWDKYLELREGEYERCISRLEKEKE